MLCARVVRASTSVGPLGGGTGGGGVGGVAVVGRVGWVWSSVLGSRGCRRRGCRGACGRGLLTRVSPGMVVWASFGVWLVVAPWSRLRVVVGCGAASGRCGCLFCGVGVCVGGVPCVPGEGRVCSVHGWCGFRRRWGSRGGGRWRRRCCSCGRRGAGGAGSLARVSAGLVVWALLGVRVVLFPGLGPGVAAGVRRGVWLAPAPALGCGCRCGRRRAGCPGCLGRVVGGPVLGWRWCLRRWGPGGGGGGGAGGGGGGGVAVVGRVGWVC